MGSGGFGAAVVLVPPCGLTGCAVGPDFAPPAAPDVNGYTPEPLATATAAAATPGGSSSALRPRSRSARAMVDAVPFQGAQQPDRKGARGQSRSASGAGRVDRRERERLCRSRARYFPPSTPISTAAGRSSRSVSRPTSAAARRPTISSPAQLNISYTPDVFGGTRRSIEVAAAQADSQRFALEATYLTLTSNLAGAAVQEASLRGQIAATQSIIKIETDVLR